MPVEWMQQYMNLPVLGLIISRLAGFLMFLPGISSAALPANIRILLVLVLALLITPLVSAPAVMPETILELLLGLASEFLLGAVVGLVAAGCFVGLQMGALLVAQEAGIAFGQIVDPSSEEQETVLGVFYVQLGLVVFLIVGGHRALVSATLDAFQTLPLLSIALEPERVVTILAQSLLLGSEVALRVAAPALVAMLLINVFIGFISRTMPQFNVMAVGFSLKSLVGFVVMAVALPSAAGALITGLERSLEWIDTFLAP